MSTASQIKFLTIEEYLDMEDHSREKHEYYQGEIFAMAGASLPHNQIVRNTMTAVDQFLKNKDCQIFPSDLKVHIDVNTLFTYPDLSILCSKPQFYKGRNDIILNPSVLIEILSPSTMDYDRGGKFALYREILSLQEYILISSKEYRFEKFTRQKDNNWIFSEVRSANETVTIDTIDFHIQLNELYRNVDFEETNKAKN